MLVSSSEVARCFKKGCGRCFRHFRACLMLGLLELVLVQDCARSLGLTRFVRRLKLQELDFLIKAKNNEKCMNNFRTFSPHISGYVYAPKVFWNLSSSKFLVMEFIDGAQVNDLRTIQELGIGPSDVSKLLSHAFAEMIFKHGFVHCDPHAANVLVLPLPSGNRSIFGKKKPQLVLLDHGLYKDLDFSTRINYASLWKVHGFSIF